MTIRNILAALLLSLCILCSLVETQLQMPFFPGMPESPLKGWHWWGGYGRHKYEYGISDNVYYHGNKCLYIHLLEPGPPTVPFPIIGGTLSQQFKADNYFHKHMKFSAVFKADLEDGSAVLTMSVQGHCHDTLAYDEMYGRNITGVQDWKRESVVLDVPDESRYIEIGITMHGEGQVWVSNLLFEEMTDGSTGMRIYEDEPRN